MWHTNPSSLWGGRLEIWCTEPLRIWLKLHFLLNPKPNKNLFGAFGLTNPLAIKSSAGYYLRKLFHDQEFFQEILVKSGLNSNRKHGVTTAHKYGCSKDNIDFHGQWKNCRRQQDTYADRTIHLLMPRLQQLSARGVLLPILLRMHQASPTNGF